MSGGLPLPCSCKAEAALLDNFPARAEGPTLPLFPNEHGNVVSTVIMLLLIEQLARALGEHILTAAGQKRFDRHSWRSTGAVWLAGTRLYLYRIQLIARWASAMVLHYARLAPLKDITERVRELETVNSLGKVIKPLTDDLASMKNKLAKMDSNTKALLEKEVAIAVAADQAKKQTPKYVTNTTTGCCHLVAMATGEPRY